MSLDATRDCFEVLGRTDPLWAVLTRRQCKHNRWDPLALFETGRQEVREVMEYLDQLGLIMGRRRALDFGCAVGRLTQALCEHFEEVVGVDIAESFLAEARRYNHHGNRCRYVLNTTDSLSQFRDDTFDFVYSNISLQHSPPEHAVKYVAEFLRILRPEGIAVFQLPAGRTPFDGTIAWLVRRFRWRFIVPLKHSWKRLRGDMVIPMYTVPRVEIERVVTAHGGRLADVVQNSAAGRGWLSFRYCVIKSTLLRQGCHEVVSLAGSQ
jgi:SAM-dependent methyltransferase